MFSVDLAPTFADTGGCRLTWKVERKEASASCGSRETLTGCNELVQSGTNFVGRACPGDGLLTPGHGHSTQGLLLAGSNGSLNFTERQFIAIGPPTLVGWGMFERFRIFIGVF